MVVTAVAGVSLGSCGSSSKPGYCADRDALAQSVNELKQVNIAPGEIDEVRSRLADVQRNAQALAQSAPDEFAPEVNAVRRAIANLRTGVGEAASAPSASSLSQVEDDASALGSSVNKLVAAVDRNC